MRILGVVENMSYLYLSDINRRVEVFGPSRGQEIADAAGAPLLAQIPIDSGLTELCDNGKIEECTYGLPEQIVNNLMDSLSKNSRGVWEWRKQQSYKQSTRPAGFSLLAGSD